MPISRRTRYRWSSLVDPSTVGDRVVLYHRQSKKALVLNPTGARLWSRLDTPRTESELAESLATHFPSLSVEQARTDTAAFVASLVVEGLLDTLE